MKRYSKTHQWIQAEGKIARMGITNYAAEQLGDIVYVELPSAGDQFTAGDPISVVESVKSTSPIYAPVSGQVLNVNEELDGAPELLNSDPEEAAWIIELNMADSSELDDLMNDEEYLTYITITNDK